MAVGDIINDPKPPGAGSRFELFVRPDIYAAGSPAKEVVVWEVWMGGAGEVKVWPIERDALIEAGRWAVDNRASWKTTGYPIRDADDVLRLFPELGK